MVVGLDIGTSYIRVAIGDYDENGKFRILGTSCEKSMGLRNGNIVNIEESKHIQQNGKRGNGMRYPVGPNRH